jgi:hypothetical protein
MVHEGASIMYALAFVAQLTSAQRFQTSFTQTFVARA